MSPVEPLPAEIEPTGMSEFSRITGVFFEPKKAFADIAVRPRWIVPLLLVILGAIGITMLYSQKGVMRVAAEQQFAKSPQFQQLSAEQREQGMERAMKISAIIAYCIPVLIPLLYIIIAAVLWAISAGILSAPVRFGQMFAIVTYAQLPGLLMSALLAIEVNIKNVADFNVQNPLMFNPGAFMDPQNSPKFLYSIASSLDLFTFWIILLIATGIKAAAGKKLSFGGALFAVVLPWTIVVLCKAALAGFTG